MRFENLKIIEIAQLVSKTIPAKIEIRIIMIQDHIGKIQIN